MPYVLRVSELTSEKTQGNRGPTNTSTPAPSSKEQSFVHDYTNCLPIILSANSNYSDDYHELGTPKRQLERPENSVIFAFSLVVIPSSVKWQSEV